LQTIESERGEKVSIEDNVVEEAEDDSVEEAEDEEIPPEFNTPEGRRNYRLRAIR